MPAMLAVPLTVLVGLLVLLTLPVSLPLIGLLHALDQRRLRAAAGKTQCVRCGQVLGPAALAAADEDLRAAWAAAHRQYPYAIVDIRRRASARCTACGAEYSWNARRRALHLLPDLADPDPAEPGCLPLWQE